MNLPDSEIVARLLKTRDGKPIVPGWTYWTKDGAPVSVRFVYVFDRTVADGNFFRTCTEADVFSEPPNPVNNIAT